MSKRNTIIAKKLKQNQTDAENLLWFYIRGERLFNLKFRRQQSIGNYIVDFVCFEKRIVIEVDGGQHAEAKNRDIERDVWLNNQGFKVLRFWNHDVLNDINSVLDIIRNNCLESPSHVSPPIKGAEITSSKWSESGMADISLSIKGGK